MTWDGIERRSTHMDGHDGRRSTDWHCPDHNQIQESTKEHRGLVCSKIRMVKEDAEKDIAALRVYHDDEVAEIKTEMDKKASTNDLRGVMKFVSIMVTVASLIIIGQAVWLRSDISDVGAKIQRLNQRVSEGVEDRVRTDMEQSRQLENISGKIEVMSWRIAQLEKVHEPGRKEGK